MSLIRLNRTLLASQSQLLSAKKLVEDYSTGKVDEPDQEKLWKAKQLVDSTFHSDTGEKIFLPFRMSSFVPTNVK